MVNQKKTLTFTVLLVALSIAFTTVFTGCDGKSSPTSPSSPIVGTYRSGGATLTFNPDGTWSFVEGGISASGTYTTSGSNIELRVNTSNDPETPAGTIFRGTYTLSGNTLTLNLTSPSAETSTWTKIS